MRGNWRYFLATVTKVLSETEIKWREKPTISQLISYPHGIQTIPSVPLKVWVLNSTPECFVQGGQDFLQHLKTFTISVGQHQLDKQLPECSVVPHLKTLTLMFM